MMPDSSWAPPTSFPSLDHETEIAIDTETYDPNLKERGPGYLRRNGEKYDGLLCGVSVATAGWKAYYPLAHPDGTVVDPAHLASYLASLCARSGVSYLFANAQYDLGWLRTLGVEVRGRICDIQVADTLIDEENPAGYTLEALCQRWLGETKNEETLRAAGNALGYDNPKAAMHKIPTRYVGPYAEADVDQTFRIFRKIKEHPEWPELKQIWDLECDVTRVLFEMMWKGVRVDLDYGQKLNERWKREEEECYRVLGFREIWEDTAVRRHFAKEGVVHHGSLDKGFLEATEHPHGKVIRKARELNRCRATFLEQNLLQNSVQGRIHPQYVQLARDDGGTRTGRLSCKNPNAQQFPKRSGLIDSKSIRKCLIPEEGLDWAKLDFWSQEPTIQCHYGLIEKLPGAPEVAEQFARGVKLYKFIEDATKGRCNYDQAKAVALGRSYGMGKAKMASGLRMDIDECGTILETFDGVAAYIGILAERFASRAQTRGWIRTLMGRRRRFNFWQPILTTEERRAVWDLKTLPKEQALKKYGLKRYDQLVLLAKYPAGQLGKVRTDFPGRPLERAFTYKAFNAGIQGSAADQGKKALVDIYKSIGLPCLAVHDEVSKSVAGMKEARIMKEIMVSAIRLRLPVKADLDLGASWC